MKQNLNHQLQSKPTSGGLSAYWSMDCAPMFNRSNDEIRTKGQRETE